MATTIRRDCAIAWEKTLRLPGDNPRSRLTRGVPHRLATKGGWRKLALELELVTGLGGLERVGLPGIGPPWGTPPMRRWAARADVAVD